MTRLDLTTERLVLRPVLVEDCDLLLAVRNHPGVVGSTDLGTIMPRERMQRQVAAWVDLWRERRAGTWVIRLDDEVVGYVALDPIGDGYSGVDPDALEIGVVIRPDLWGRGIAREAGAAVVTDCLDRVGLPAVYATVDVSNTRSSALLERSPGARLLDGGPSEHLYELTGPAAGSA